MGCLPSYQHAAEKVGRVFEVGAVQFTAAACDWTLDGLKCGRMYSGCLLALHQVWKSRMLLYFPASASAYDSLREKVLRNVTSILDWPEHIHTSPKATSEAEATAELFVHPVHVAVTV